MLRHTPIVIAFAGVFVTTASADILDVPTVDYPTIQSAIEGAVNGDVIVIQPRDPDLGFPFDAYYENLDMLGKEITLTSIDPTDPEIVATTVIDGSGSNASCIRVDHVGTTGLIDGLTFRGGDQTGSLGVDRGGGLRSSDNAELLVRRCVFADNEAIYGGAVYIDNPGSFDAPTFEDCFFHGNHAVDDGSSSIAGSGGAVYCNERATFRRCVFDGNSAEDRGGGVHIGVSNFEDCTFTNNHCVDYGGGMNTVGTTTLIRCRFQDNSCDTAGGGIAFRDGNPVCRDSVFDGNDSLSVGGGVAADVGAFVTLDQVTIADNTAVDASAMWINGATVNMRNSVVWANTGGTGVDVAAGSLTATYTNSQTALAGDSNLSADPLFADVANNDFSLLPGSPCIDRGDTNVVVGETPVDFAGNNRALDDPDTVDAGVPVIHITVDLGAFEFVPDGPIVTCEGDLNGDSIVDVADLLIILGAWGVCP